MVYKIFNWFISCSIFILITACSDSSPNEIRFHPKKGDVYEYTAQIIMDINIEARFGGQSERLISSTLSRYKVISINNNTAKIELKPEVFDLYSSNRMMGNFSSRSADKEDKFTQLMEDGFIFEVDLKTGNTVSIQANNKKIWQEILNKDDGKKILDTLNKQLTVPVITMPIPKTIGAEVELKSFQGMSDITLKVEDINNNEALLTLSATGDYKVYGRLVVDINTGWPKKIAIATEAPLQEKNITGTAQFIINAQQGRQNFIEAYDIVRYIARMDLPSYDFYTFDLWLDKPLIEEDVFPSSKGVIDFNDTAFYLNYRSTLNALSKGNYKILDIDLLPHQQSLKKIDLLHIQQYRNSYNTIAFLNGYTPVVWSEAKKLIEPITAVKAKVAYFPYEKKPLTFKLNTNQPTVVNAADSSITFTPLNTNNAFLITMRSTDGSWIDITSMKSNNKLLRAQVMPVEKKYKWLQSMDVNLIKNVQLGIQKENQYNIFFKELPIEEITVDVITIVDKPLYQKEITFIPQQEYDSDISLSPFYEYLDTTANKEQNISEVKPIGGKQLHFLQLNLSKLQASSCQLKVTKAPKVNNQQLKWIKNTYIKDSYKYGDIEQWQLTTEDEITKYFYGVNVENELICNNTISWAPVAYQHNKQPWLIDLNQLSNYKIEPEQPISKLYEQYRFLNKQGHLIFPSFVQALSGNPVDKQEKLKNYPLKDFLVDGRYLRLSAELSTIVQKQHSDKPYRYTWTTAFEPIICEQEDKACPR